MVGVPVLFQSTIWTYSYSFVGSSGETTTNPHDTWNYVNRSITIKPAVTGEIIPRINGQWQTTNTSAGGGRYYTFSTTQILFNFEILDDDIVEFFIVKGTSFISA